MLCCSAVPSLQHALLLCSAVIYHSQPTKFTIFFPVHEGFSRLGPLSREENLKKRKRLLKPTPRQCSTPSHVIIGSKQYYPGVFSFIPLKTYSRLGENGLDLKGVFFADAYPRQGRSAYYNVRSTMVAAAYYLVDYCNMLHYWYIYIPGTYFFKYGRSLPFFQRRPKLSAARVASL